MQWVSRRTGTPKDRDEVNRREDCEFDGWVCDLNVIGAPSNLSVIRRAAALVRMFPTRDLSIEEKVVRWKWKNPQSCCASWTPEAAKKRSVSRWACKNESLINLLCNLPDVLALTGIKDATRRSLIIISVIFQYFIVEISIWINPLISLDKN